LTKGPVPAALFAAAGLVSWGCGGPSACWKRLEWRRGLLLLSLVTLPWFLAIGILSRGEFYRIAVGYHIIQRVTSGIEEHGGFPGYYVVLSLLTFYPWSALLPPALFGAWSRRGGSPALGFLLGWIFGPLLFLELVRTKLIHYYLPAYPACALLVAWLIVTLVGEEVALRRWSLGRLGLGLLNALGIGTVVALIAAACVVDAPVRWPCLVLALVLAAGTLSAALSLYRGATERGVARLLATWAVLGLLLGTWLLPALEPYRMARRVGQRLASISARLGLEPVLLTFQEPSTIYAYGRPVPTVKVWEDLYEQLRRHGEVITPLLDHELRGLQAQPFLIVEPGEQMTGFNLSKGHGQSLTFTRVRPNGDWARRKQSPVATVPAPAPAPRVAGRQSPPS
jgi:4-amino-4-deoxy-L-arabinose transferase-like glycosyltransferase